ncbi:MAG: S-layer homology domain-containing protein [Selenomonadaceae bacterium]|nr:S-layer homology domain-containing protein [Selenomonadaceae bacterium]
MKKFLATMATAAILTVSASTVSAAEFNDVNSMHWAYPSVTAMANAKIIPPSKDGKFYGDRNITRSEMAQMSANLLLKLSPESKAAAKKIVKKYSDNGDKAATRFEIASMLAEVYNKVHKGELPAASTTFVDVPAEHWAAESVNLMAAIKVMEGYGDGTFNGDQKMTRYEAALTIANLYKMLSA